MRRETATQTASLRLADAEKDASDGWPAACLMVVATPIGNLSDMSPRAHAALRSASLIACEDRRVSRVFFDGYGPPPATVCIEQHREADAVARVLEHLASGARCALITDAGTPAISDPGHHVVAAARKSGFRVIPVPGTCAFVTLASVAGFQPAPLWFEGFLPARDTLRQARLRQLLDLAAHVLLYEAPHRILATATALGQLAPLRRLCVGRELTKLHEETAVLTGEAFAQWVAAAPARMRGEFCLMIEIAKACGEEPSLTASARQRRYLLEREAMMIALLQELPPARAARTMARMTGDAKTDRYRLALEVGGTRT